MKFLKPLLFGLLLTGAQAEEFVLKLSNNMAKHRVSEQCEIEFYSNTKGELWLSHTINGEHRGASKVHFEANEPISYYWQDDASTLWTISPTKVRQTRIGKNSFSSYITQHVTDKSKPADFSSNETVQKIVTSHMAGKNLDAQPGIHLKNILAKHSLGEQTIDCYLDTKGSLWLGRNGGASTISSAPNARISVYYNTDSQKLWIIHPHKAIVEDLKKKFTEGLLLDQKSLKQHNAPAKVIELAKELNPSL